MTDTNTKEPTTTTRPTSSTTSQTTNIAGCDEAELRQRKRQQTQRHPFRARREREREARRSGVPLDDSNKVVDLIVSISGLVSLAIFGSLANKYYFHWY
jgi:hypothetical protein